jgi:hypothetical protein
VTEDEKISHWEPSWYVLVGRYYQDILIKDKPDDWDMKNTWQRWEMHCFNRKCKGNREFVRSKRRCEGNIKKDLNQKHLHFPSAKVGNGWSYICTSPCNFMLWTGTNLLVTCFCLSLVMNSPMCCYWSYCLVGCDVTQCDMYWAFGGPLCFYLQGRLIYIVHLPYEYSFILLMDLALSSETSVHI